VDARLAKAVLALLHPKAAGLRHHVYVRPDALPITAALLRLRKSSLPAAPQPARPQPGVQVKSCRMVGAS